MGEDYDLNEKKERRTLLGVSWADFFACAMFCLMGLGPWHMVNTIWSQLPALIRAEPEGKSLATYLNLVIQGGNVFVLLYLAVLKGKVGVGNTVLLLVCIVTACFYALAFLWDETVSSHSIALILLAFAGGSVGNLSNVVAWPFVSQYRPVLSSSLSFGLSLSAVIVSMLAFGQDVGGDDPRFSVQTDFLISAGTTTACLLATLLVTRTSLFDAFKKTDSSSLPSLSASSSAINKDTESTPLLLGDIPTSIVGDESMDLQPGPKRWLRSRCVLFVLMTLWMFGIIPGISPYLTQTPQQLFIFTTCGQMACVLASVLSHFSFFHGKEPLTVTLLCICGITAVLLVVTIPTPPSYVGSVINPILYAIVGAGFQLTLTTTVIAASFQFACSPCQARAVRCAMCETRTTRYVGVLAASSTLAAGVGSLLTFLVFQFLI
eukprot:m.12445 g.12445  ORF g.12445 m.12445 type:complete len:434 (+) comp6015_c0_seq1:77-1378(+)